MLSSPGPVRTGPMLDRAFWLGLVFSAVVGMASIVAIIDRLAERHLLADAERTSSAWARHIGSTVPDIDLVLMGEVPSPPAQDVLTGLRGTAGLFRFHLYDVEGREVLHSESIGTPVPDEQRRVDGDARAVAAGAPPRTQLHRSSGKVGPAVWTVAVVPIVHGTHPVGVAAIELDQTDRAAVTAQSFRTAAAIAALALFSILLVGTWLWRRRLQNLRATEERARYLAHHDQLTGTLNRASFRESLEQACQAPERAHERIAVLCIDLDRFKEVNDLHGHAVGDLLLHEVADRLRPMLRSGDLLARLGADQFAVLQTGVDDHKAVGVLAKRILDALARPHDLAGTAVELSASIGAALHGVDGKDADALLHAAELALTRAKTDGGGAWGFYDAALDKALQERRELTHDLREALAQGSLRLHYQPVVDARSGTLVGYEALARWPHPLRGFVPPSEFIPLAEETGLIEALGRWVLESACREAATWPAPLRVAVNLSPSQFGAEGDLVALIERMLAETGLAPGRLEVEITESLLMRHSEQVIGTLDALHRLGVRIAMDDFGTGYSSLAYLWRFPFDKVKIDRAFTQRLGQERKVDLIVRSIVHLAHALSIRVNAEGVETEAQRQSLREHGCDELQGFLLGRPLPPERLLHREEAAEAA